MTVVQSLDARRRDQLAALYAQRDYRAAAESRRTLATELRGRGYRAIADQLDAAADMASRAMRAERDYQARSAT